MHKVIQQVNEWANPNTKALADLMLQASHTLSLLKSGKMSVGDHSHHLTVINPTLLQLLKHQPFVFLHLAKHLPLLLPQPNQPNFSG